MNVYDIYGYTGTALCLLGGFMSLAALFGQRLGLMIAALAAVVAGGVFILLAGGGLA